MKIFFIVCMCAMLSGCAGKINLTRDTQGRLTEITASGPIEASGKTAEDEWSVKSGGESPLKEVVSFNAFRSDK